MERFLDTPVKHYSSGMYVRLAFAVAAHLEPEILIVDEVLAVGDAEFQKKCLGKMRDVSQGGRTVLFVSHNMAAVQALCSRAIWLDKGAVAYDGGVDDCVNHYLTKALTHRGIRPGEPTFLGPSLELQRFDVFPNPIESGTRLDCSLTFGARAPTRITELALLFYSSQEVRVAIVDMRSPSTPASIAARWRVALTGWIKSLPLVEGDYRLGLDVVSSDFIGNHFGLVELKRRGAITPGLVMHRIQPVHRGVLELEFGVNA